MADNKKFHFILHFAFAAYLVFSLTNAPDSKPSRTPQSVEENAKPVSFFDVEKDHEVTDPETLCSLPSQFIRPEIYKKYCSMGSCLAYGKDCSLSSKCCSGICLENRCAASATVKGYSGQRCQLHSDCYSNSCMIAGNYGYKVCIGSSDPSFCANVTMVCKEDSNCCSGRCNKNRCIGSPSDPSPLGGYCFADHSECESGQCNLQTHRCE